MRQATGTLSRSITGAIAGTATAMADIKSMATTTSIIALITAIPGPTTATATAIAATIDLIEATIVLMVATIGLMVVIIRMAVTGAGTGDLESALVSVLASEDPS